MIAFERVGEDFIIGVPHAEGKEPAVPPDAVLLKNSEYWTRKEAAEEEAA